MTTIVINNDLLLRTYNADDHKALFDAVNNSRKHLAAWLPWVARTTRPEHSLQFIQQSQEQMHSQQGLPLGIFLNGNIIGGIGMHDWQHDLKRAQLGYWIAGEHEGKGIIMQCIIPFINYLFDKTDLNKIEIHYSAANTRSAKLASRLGFAIEGIIRQGSIRNGIIENLVITGILKSEWNAEYVRLQNAQRK